MKKGVTYIISTLFLMLIFTSTVNARISDEIPQYTIKRNDMGDILYVGGSGLHNYSRIQDAVDNASAGDIIFVYNKSSPYYENIIIKKNDLQLIGKQGLNNHRWK